METHPYNKDHDSDYDNDHKKSKSAAGGRAAVAIELGPVLHGGSLTLRLRLGLRLLRHAHSFLC